MEERLQRILEDLAHMGRVENAYLVRDHIEAIEEALTEANARADALFARKLPCREAEVAQARYEAAEAERDASQSREVQLREVLQAVYCCHCSAQPFASEPCAELPEGDCWVPRRTRNWSSPAPDLGERLREAEARVKELEAERTSEDTYCAYCGVVLHEATFDEVRAHIFECPVHPIRAVESERDRLQEELNLWAGGQTRSVLVAERDRLQATLDAKERTQRITEEECVGLYAERDRLREALEMIAKMTAPTELWDVEDLRREVYVDAHAALHPAGEVTE